MAEYFLKTVGFHAEMTVLNKKGLCAKLSVLRDVLEMQALT